MARALTFVFVPWAAFGRPVFPDIMIAGYTDQAPPEQVLNAVQDGANVLFWSFMELQEGKITTKGLLQGNVTAEKVQPIHEGLVAMGRTDVIHMLSLGGWGVDHRSADSCGEQLCTGAAYASSFRSWNADIMQNVPGFEGFAGIDWDLEGVNDLNSPFNLVKQEELQIILDMSDALSQDFLVTMVPPQSYFDCRQPNFDLSLRHPATSTASFHYHGWNTYAALYAKCPQCFDLVMVQLYEGWSRAGFDLFWDGDESNIGVDGWPRNGTEDAMVDVLLQNMRCLVEGFDVDFGGFMGLGQERVALPADKVVIGLGQSWTARNFKSPWFTGSAAGAAWCRGLLGSTARARGFAYWAMSYDTPDSSYAGALAAGMADCSSTIAV